ncbi:ADP-ribosylglycohydrolase family protein [Cereibacter sphaeroides]
MTHPLLIAELPVADGRIGLTFCPGKAGPSLQGDPWCRDLDTDLEALWDWGAATVVTLMEPAELSLLQVEGLGAGVRRRGMDWLHLPIPDLSAPPAGWMALWEPVSPRLHAALEAGERVLLHCRGGLGRTGTVAALMLIERGAGAAEAMARVRAVRPGAIETRAQEAFLEARAATPDLRTQRVRAALFGGAMGDALGAGIEFWSLDRIRAAWPRGIVDLPMAYGRRGAITDDTQMTLFTAEGLIRARVRGMARGICDPAGVVHHALLRWYGTQGGRPQVPDLCRKGLVADPRLHASRAPGASRWSPPSGVWRSPARARPPAPSLPRSPRRATAGPRRSSGSAAAGWPRKRWRSRSMRALPRVGSRRDCASPSPIPATATAPARSPERFSASSTPRRR